MRVCGYRDLASEKEALYRRQKYMENTALSIERLKVFLPDKNWSNPEFWSKDGTTSLQPPDLDDADSTNAEIGLGSRMPLSMVDISDSAAASSSNHENDRPPRPTSPSSNATAAASRSTSPAPSVDSVTLPTPTPEKVPDKQKENLDPHPRWTGCLSFSCSPFRSPGDHRSRCSASFKECAGCKVHICKTCTDNMPKPCRCDWCMERSVVGPPNPGTNVPTVSATINGMVFAPHPAPAPAPGANTTSIGVSFEASRFWCPNCRWERIRLGRCKAGQLQSKGKGRSKGKEKAKEKMKNRSSSGSDRTARPPPAPTGIDDETAQNVAEFEDLIARGDEALITELDTVAGPVDRPPTPTPTPDDETPTASAPAIPAAPSLISLSAIPEEAVTDSGEVDMERTENAADERDLDRISAMVADLQARIERLRVAYASRRQQDQDDALGGGEASQQESTAGGNAEGAQVESLETGAGHAQAEVLVEVEGMD